MGDMFVSSNTNKALQEIQDLPVALLQPAFSVLIPADHGPTAAFWAPYNNKERNIGIRACLLVWTVTNFKLVPQEFQLEATIAIMTGKDLLVDVGTGYGKTLCMIIPSLLDPENLSVIFLLLSGCRRCKLSNSRSMASKLWLLTRILQMIQICGRSEIMRPY